MNNSSVVMKIFLFSLEQSINKALEWDSAAQQQLRSLGQQSIKTYITDWNTTFYLLLLGNKVELLEFHQPKPDCSIQCSLIELLNLVNEDDEGQMQFHENAEISGNSDLLIRLREILTSAEPDYEAVLTRWLGPVVAHQLGQIARAGAKWADSVRKSLVDDIQLYIHEESALFPHPFEVEAFTSEISQLQAEVETLTETIAQLRSEKMAETESGTPIDSRGSSSCD
jgi:ubiquinone biosynthesis protein UbiJ